MFAAWDQTDIVTGDERATDTSGGGVVAVTFTLIALLGTVAFVATGASDWPGWVTAAAATLWVGALTLLGDVIERRAGGRTG